MDFDDHEDQDEEMGLPVGSSYESPPANSSRGGAGGVAVGKMGGGGGGGDSGVLAAGGGSRKGGGGGGGGAKYRECLKNHAVSIGGHALDGCGEFMAAGEEGTLDALKCAACNCHRNFHRKEAEGGGVGSGLGMRMEGGGGFHHQFSPYYRTPAGYLHHPHPHMAAAEHARPSAALPLALPCTSGGGGGVHSRDDQEDLSDPMAGGSGGGGGGASSAGGKKRFRTKFTQEQKDKMLAFAERLGWRIQKHDDAAVQQFCADSCVKRHVLKVWMHNNKHTLGKKP